MKNSTSSYNILEQMPEVYKKMENGKYRFELISEDDKVISTLVFQDGCEPDVGRNGFTIEEVLLICAGRLRFYNSELPDRHNSIAITHIEDALAHLQMRTIDRCHRGVEGTNKK